MEKAKKEMLMEQIVEQMNNDREFCRDFVSAEDAPSVQKVLCSHGYEITTQEVEELYSEGVRGILDYTASHGDALSEADLEEVAGGGVIRGTLRLAVSCAAGYGYGCLCGVCPAAYAGAKWVAGGLAVWTAAGYAKKGW